MNATHHARQAAAPEWGDGSEYLTDADTLCLYAAQDVADRAFVTVLQTHLHCDDGQLTDLVPERYKDRSTSEALCSSGLVGLAAAHMVVMGLAYLAHTIKDCASALVKGR